MPPNIHRVLKEKQAELKEQTGRYYSLEFVIYRIIREHTGLPHSGLQAKKPIKNKKNKQNT